MYKRQLTSIWKADLFGKCKSLIYSSFVETDWLILTTGYFRVSELHQINQIHTIRLLMLWSLIIHFIWCIMKMQETPKWITKLMWRHQLTTQGGQVTAWGTHIVVRVKQMSHPLYCLQSPKYSISVTNFRCNSQSASVQVYIQTWPAAIPSRKMSEDIICVKTFASILAKGLLFRTFIYGFAFPPNVS